MELTYIYGKHAVLEALRRRPECISELYIKEDFDLEPNETKLLKQVATVKNLDQRRLPAGLDRKAVHQGWVAILDTESVLIPFKTFKHEVKAEPGTSLVILGEVQDPHNVGAIIRSAAAFGAAAVLIPKHRQPQLTGTVIKTSAGAAFSIPLVSVGNVNSALRELKELGFWVYGLDMEGDTTLHEETFPKPSAFVVGNEGRGVRVKTHELCDSILSIPISGSVESLNASVGAAVALYAFSARYPGVVINGSAKA